MSVDLKTVKEELEEREYKILATYATKSRETKGRKFPRVDDCPIRTE